MDPGVPIDPLCAFFGLHQWAASQYILPTLRDLTLSLVALIYSNLDENSRKLYIHFSKILLWKECEFCFHIVTANAHKADFRSSFSFKSTFHIVFENRFLCIQYVLRPAASRVELPRSRPGRIFLKCSQVRNQPITAKNRPTNHGPDASLYIHNIFVNKQTRQRERQGVILVSN